MPGGKPGTRSRFSVPRDRVFHFVVAGFSLRVKSGFDSQPEGCDYGR